MSVPLSVSASSCNWESYPWKNELAEQLDRVEVHFAEAADDEYEGEHNPLHMLERALVLAAFAVRRMIEKRLVTDRLVSHSVSIRSFPARGRLRRPMHGASGGQVFENYDFEAPAVLNLPMAKVANEIIHSSQLLVLSGLGLVKDGLLIASDFGLKTRLLHLTIEEFRGYARLVLDDRIRLSADDWDHETGKVTARRE